MPRLVSLGSHIVVNQAPEGRHSSLCIAPSGLKFLDNLHSDGFATGIGCFGPSALRKMRNFKTR
jgi:hypothetical protein